MRLYFGKAILPALVSLSTWAAIGSTEIKDFAKRSFGIVHYLESGSIPSPEVAEIVASTYSEILKERQELLEKILQSANDKTIDRILNKVIEDSKILEKLEQEFEGNSEILQELQALKETENKWQKFAEIVLEKTLGNNGGILSLVASRKLGGISEGAIPDIYLRMPTNLENFGTLFPDDKSAQSFALRVGGRPQRELLLLGHSLYKAYKKTVATAGGTTNVDKKKLKDALEKDATVTAQVRRRADMVLQKQAHVVTVSNIIPIAARYIYSCIGDKEKEKLEKELITVFPNLISSTFSGEIKDLKDILRAANPIITVVKTVNKAFDNIKKATGRENLSLKYDFEKAVELLREENKITDKSYDSLLEKVKKVSDEQLKVIKEEFGSGAAETVLTAKGFNKTYKITRTENADKKSTLQFPLFLQALLLFGTSFGTLLAFYLVSKNKKKSSLFGENQPNDRPGLTGTTETRSLEDGTRIITVQSQ